MVSYFLDGISQYFPPGISQTTLGQISLKIFFLNCEGKEPMIFAPQMNFHVPPYEVNGVVTIVLALPYDDRTMIQC